MLSTKTFWKSKYNLFIVFLMVLTLGMWVVVQMQHTVDANLNYYFSLMLGVVPFLASLKGFMAAKRWGGMSSVLGRSIGLLSLGLFLWSAGELIWSYYNLVLEVEAPYPSVADVGFASGVTLYAASTVLLTRLAGVNLVLKKKPLLWWGIIILCGLSVALTYYLAVVVAKQGEFFSDTTDKLKTFLDVFYPVADFVSFTLVAIIAAIAGKYLGGKLRLPLILTFLGMLVMYFGDIIFSYTTTVGTFYNANWGDLVLFAGANLLALSLLAYNESVPRLKVQENEG